MNKFDTFNLVNQTKRTGYFTLSEENIINQFTMSQTDSNGCHEYAINKFFKLEKNETEENNNMNNNLENRLKLCQKKISIENDKPMGHKELNDNCDEYNDPKSNSPEHSKWQLLNKIRNLENEKKQLLQFLEDKKNQEIQYKQVLETQKAIMNSENKKCEFYEKEWLRMRSLEYCLLNSGETPLRDLLEKHYKNGDIYKQIGTLTKTQEKFVVNLIEDHKKLIQEKNIVTKKYHDAVDSNFQLYQQNEMLKAQNICLLDNNTEQIHQELEKKLSALNSSLILVQKENIEMKEILDQYTRLITNIKHCSKMSEITDELNKFSNYISI